MVVGVLEEAGVDLHLPGENRLEVVGHVIPGGDLRVSRGQFRVRWNDTEFLLAYEDLLAERVPAGVEPAFVLVRPLRRDVVRGVGGAGCVVHEEWLVGHQRLLLPRPLDRLVGHVVGEVVALLGRLLRLHGRRALVDGGVVLVRLAADEAVKVLETRAAGRPGVEGSHRARLPDRYLVALAELRRRVAVHKKGLGQRCTRVGAHGVVPGCRGCQLGDDLPSRPVWWLRPLSSAARVGAHSAVVWKRLYFKPFTGQPFGGRRVAGPAKGARGGKADIVEQDDQHVRCACGRAHRLIGGNDVAGSLASNVIGPV